MLPTQHNFTQSAAIFQSTSKQRKGPENSVFSGPLAEKEGFEPSRQLSHPTPLAGEPLRPLGYFSTILSWRRERDSNPRCLSASLVFKTSALNHSAISPEPNQRRILYQIILRMSTSRGELFSHWIISCSSFLESCEAQKGAPPLDGAPCENRGISRGRGWSFRSPHRRSAGD